MTDPDRDSARRQSGPSAGEPDERTGRSGLRNPTGAARAVGAAALAAELVTLLLTIVPMVKLGGPSTGAVIGLILALVAVCAVLLGLLRHGWAWYAAFLPPAALIAATWLRIALGVLGSLFLLLWVFVLYVRRTVLKPPVRG